MENLLNNNSVPTLSPDIEIYGFNDNEFIVEQLNLNYRVNISIQTKRLIELIDGNKNLHQIQEEYLKLYGLKIPIETIEELIYTRLGKYGIVLQNRFEVERKKREKYLSLSFIFLRKSIVDTIVKPLNFLFKKNVFYSVLTATLAIVLSTILLNFNEIIQYYDSGGFENIVIYLLLFQLGGVVHELGHAAACKSFGAKNGGIGFGFYLLMPALFTDVTDAWRLSVKERVIVNLAGIYFELICASVFILFYFTTYDKSYLVLPSIFIISTLYNLNPFIRLDGYWVLSDITKSPNLYIKSRAITKHGAKKLLNFEFNTFLTLNKFHFIYGVISISFVFFFLGYMLFNYSDSIFNFPILVFNKLSNITTVEFSSLKELLLPALFWYIIIQRTIKYLKSKSLLRYSK